MRSCTNRCLHFFACLPACLYISLPGVRVSVPCVRAQLRQSFPRNLPLLTAYTTAWAVYVGVFSLMFTKGSVMRAVFQAAIVVGERRCPQLIPFLPLAPRHTGTKLRSDVSKPLQHLREEGTHDAV